jgi:hypothetical protein
MASGSESDHDDAQVGGVLLVLLPHEARFVAKVKVADERHLRHNYDICSSVHLHFQDSATRTINDGEVAIFERMLMVGLRFPFPTIARELVTFLGVTPMRIVSNAWRYLFAFFIL